MQERRGWQANATELRGHVKNLGKANKEGIKLDIRKNYTSSNSVTSRGKTKYHWIQYNGVRAKKHAFRSNALSLCGIGIH